MIGRCLETGGELGVGGGPYFTLADGKRGSGDGRQCWHENHDFDILPKILDTASAQLLPRIPAWTSTL
jgi:hypothetical protein